MTNVMIVLFESVSLMEKGILKGTGEYTTVDNPDGSKTELEVPEPIHTYAGWKQLGFQVKRGEKATAKFPIWKYRYGTKEVEMKNVATGQNEMMQIDDSKMFMKTASWFTYSQVEHIKDAH